MYIEGISFTSQLVAVGCFVLHCRSDKAVKPKQDWTGLVLGWSTTGCAFSMLKIVCFNTLCYIWKRKLHLYVPSEVVDSDWSGVTTLYESIGAKFANPIGSHLLVHEHLVQSGTPHHAGGDRLSMGNLAMQGVIGLSVGKLLTRQALQLRLQMPVSNTQTSMNTGEKLLNVTETSAKILHTTGVTDSI
jgi:hypothetical protein